MNDALTIENMKANQPADVHERAGYWQGNALVLAHLMEALEKALEEIRDLKPREKPLPADHWDQIRACPECQRYADHPVQRGICNDHRRPMWDREKYEAHEERALGYRARGLARDALAGRAPLEQPSPVKMLIDADWLSRKVETDPDVDTDAGRATLEQGNG